MSGIYKIINKINGKYYVGSAKNIRSRWNGHRHLLNKNIHKNPHLQNSWNKYGIDNFEFIIIEEIEPRYLLIEEQKYLDIAKTEQDKCYNKSFLADRIEMTPQVIDKIRESNRKRIWSKTSLLKLSKIHKGQKHTEESKIKIKNKLMGHIHSKETKEKICKSRINLKIFKMYDVKNVKTKESFKGNYYDLIKKLNMSKRSVSSLINGHINKCKNWIIVY
jgi:group I intron endonuclease